MNETLEATARALFESWFVDFDPVRAKAAGREPCLPKYLSDVFPDSFDDSELGEIPKGWEVKSVGDLADVVGGTTPSTKQPEYWDGGTHAWATPKDLSGLSVPVLLETERRITDAGLSQIGSGLLPMGTVLLSSRAPIGYLAIAEIPVAINQGFIAMTPKAGISNLFLLLWARVAHKEIVSRANGSTFLEISKSNFRSHQASPDGGLNVCRIAEINVVVAAACPLLRMGALISGLRGSISHRRSRTGYGPDSSLAGKLGPFLRVPNAL
jgi:type I restriction enzyme S subunit